MNLFRNEPGGPAMDRGTHFLCMTAMLGTCTAAWAGDLANANVKTGSVVVVEACYPGANAKVVADAVAAPIEQQMLGLGAGVHLQSRSTDGSYRLAVRFSAEV